MADTVIKNINWQKVKLGTIADFSNGRATKITDSGKFLIYGSNGLIGWGDNYNYEDGVVIGRVGAYCGSLKYEKSKFWATDNTIVGKLKNESENKYLYYLLRILALNHRAGGSAQPLLTQDILNSIEVIFPIKSDDQKKIASMLSAFDDKIEVNNKIVKTLEEMAQVLFKEWFVHLRFTGYEKAEFVDSELGKIPVGWDVKNLGQILTLKHGYAFKSEQFTTNKTKNIVVRMGNFQETGGLQFSDNTFYLTSIDGYANYILKPSDIVMILSDITRKGRLIGKVGLIPQDENIYVLNQRVAKVETEAKYKYFLLLLFNSKIFHQHCLARADSATVLNLKNEHIYDYQLVVPQESVLKEFNKVSEPILAKLESIREENQKLAALRDLLLPKLMRGEVGI